MGSIWPLPWARLQPQKQLDDELAKWRSRPLPEIQFLILDATYYKVRIDGTVRDCAPLKAIGIRRDDGKRMILGGMGIAAWRGHRQACITGSTTVANILQWGGGNQYITPVHRRPVGCEWPVWMRATIHRMALNK